MAAPFLLATGDLTDPEELESRAKQIVGGAQHYHEGTLLVKRAEMLKRMELASIFDPIAAMGSLPTERDIDSLKLFRFSRKPGYAALLPKLKGELPQYISKVKPIKPDKERRDSEGKDTFDFLAWWRSHMADLPSWAAFLRALLCNAPNSCPPERVFSILNDSFDADQKHALADYMQFSLMAQYNNRDPQRD